jgi:hypothetical protein
LVDNQDNIIYQTLAEQISLFKRYKMELEQDKDLTVEAFLDKIKNERDSVTQPPEATNPDADN